MSLTPEIQWERVLNYGRVAHVINGEKTVCGRDISYQRTRVVNNPVKKCKRCLEIKTQIRTQRGYSDDPITQEEYFPNLAKLQPKLLTA